MTDHLVEHYARELNRAVTALPRRRRTRRLASAATLTAAVAAAVVVVATLGGTPSAAPDERAAAPVSPVAQLLGPDAEAVPVPEGLPERLPMNGGVDLGLERAYRVGPVPGPSLAERSDFPGKAIDSPTWLIVEGDAGWCAYFGPGGMCTATADHSLVQRLAAGALLSPTLSTAEGSEIQGIVPAGVVKVRAETPDGTVLAEADVHRNAFRLDFPTEPAAGLRLFLIDADGTERRSENY